MPQIINTNIASLTAQRNLNKSQSQYQTALTRLSSGLRINSAADDPAGLAIASRFQAQINGTGQAIKNANDGINLAQTAGSALSSITDNLQRIRELAVQSANDTNSGTDRKSLQQEVAQLQKEIQTTASTTNFNGKKLLDGSFQKQQFQVGANVGETINVSLNKVDASTLGTAQSAGLSGQLSQTQLTGVATTGNVKLASGDLVINGTSVGASTATADTSSTVLQSSSAIAKAAAINAVSDQSGVTATANANTAQGNVVTATGTTALATTSFSVSINGQSFTLSTTAPSSPTSTDVQKQLQSVADQINQKQDATGVSASVVSTTTSGGVAGYRIDLTAKDGRNIAISSGDTASSDNTSKLGLAKSAGMQGNSQVYVGTVSLSSKDGSNINLSTTTGSIDNAGFSAGSFSGVNGGAVAESGAYATSGSGTGRYALSSGDLVINGVSVGATSGISDNASTADNSASAISLAAAINNVSGQTGVSATANQNNVYGGSIAKLVSGTTYSAKINGVDVSFTAGADTATTQSNLLNAVNQKSGQTGVTASALGSDQFTLSASDGRNIDVAGSTVNTSTSLTTINTDGTTGSGTKILAVQDNIGSVSLQSAGQFTLGSTTGNISNAGLNVGTFGGSESGTKISDVNISTVSGANAAIKAVDNALNTISTNQATLGAVQNRFSATVSTLTSLSNNLTSAQSSIQDADFAKQTAALSRAQVLQQAGISILAQANAQPKQVLSLLQ